MYELSDSNRPLKPSAWFIAILLLTLFCQTTALSAGVSNSTLLDPISKSCGGRDAENDGREKLFTSNVSAGQSASQGKKTPSRGLRVFFTG
jgi:hypothetical protein